MKPPGVLVMLKRRSVLIERPLLGSTPLPSDGKAANCVSCVAAQIAAHRHRADDARVVERVLVGRRRPQVERVILRRDRQQLERRRRRHAQPAEGQQQIGVRRIEVEVRRKRARDPPPTKCRSIAAAWPSRRPAPRPGSQVRRRPGTSASRRSRTDRRAPLRRRPPCRDRRTDRRRSPSRRPSR